MDVKSKDAAEFVRLLLRQGRLNKRGVIKWAESVVAEYSDVPSWMLDLAWAEDAHVDEIESLLQNAPGQVTDDVPRKMVASILREEWLSNRCSDEEFADGWYALFPDYPEDDDSIHAAPVWQYLDEVLLSIYPGDNMGIALESARSELAQLLEPYACFEPLTRAFGRTRR